MLLKQKQRLLNRLRRQSNLWVTMEKNRLKPVFSILTKHIDQLKLSTHQRTRPFDIDLDVRLVTRFGIDSSSCL